MKALIDARVHECYGVQASSENVGRLIVAALQEKLQGLTILLYARPGKEALCRTGSADKHALTG